MSDATPFGAYAAAKLDFMRAALHIEKVLSIRPGVVVNTRGTRRLHPHGQRMVQDGLMELIREVRGERCRRTVLVVTEEGRAELARLEKRAARTARRHGATGQLPGPVPTQKGRARLDRKTKAIAFLKGRPRHADLA